MFWKKDLNVLVAMEVGSCKIAVAVAEMREDGSLTLLGVGEGQSGKVRKCEIIDFEIAQNCVHDALRDAEQKTDVEIHDVFLALGGAHVKSATHRFSTAINSEGNEITRRDLDDLRDMARSHPLPQDAALLHDLLQHYYLDDGTVATKPVGISSKCLQADYHIIYGMGTRLETTIRCVKELSIDVRDYALSIYATAQAVLTPAQKLEGAIVINCGGGVTDYLVYNKGAVVHTGVLGVGGEHLTNDLSVGLKIPFSKAEELKRTEGSVVLNPEERNDILTIPDACNFQEQQIYRESMVTILNARQSEIFEIILENLQDQTFWAEFEGTVYLTGGGSQMGGILELAREIFPCYCAMAHNIPMDGAHEYLERPELSTVLGMLQYARSIEINQPQLSGWAGMRHSIKKVLSGMKLL